MKWPKGKKSWTEPSSGIIKILNPSHLWSSFSCSPCLPFIPFFSAKSKQKIARKLLLHSITASLIKFLRTWDHRFLKIKKWSTSYLIMLLKYTQKKHMNYLVCLKTPLFYHSCYLHFKFFGPCPFVNHLLIPLNTIFILKISHPCYH